jgi:hypothetical protein
MTDEERLESEEEEDVEAHRRAALSDEASENEENDEDGDDVEAHRRRAV